MSEPREEQAEPRTGEIVVREQAAAPAPGRRWARNVDTVRARLPELARNPAVVATATLGTTLAVGAVRQALRGGALPGGGTPRQIVLTGHIVEHVHVIHHVVVHHVTRTPLPPSSP